MSEPKRVSILPGCSGHEHKDWLIGPVGVHRDSEVVDRANWEAVINAYEKADPDQNDWHTMRFGHWAVGWVEEVAYRPGSKIAELASEFRERLEDYPILDEHILSRMEAEEEEAREVCLGRGEGNPCCPPEGDNE